MEIVQSRRDDQEKELQPYKADYKNKKDSDLDFICNSSKWYQQDAYTEKELRFEFMATIGLGSYLYIKVGVTMDLVQWLM